MDPLTKQTLVKFKATLFHPGGSDANHIETYITTQDQLDLQRQKKSIKQKKIHCLLFLMRIGGKILDNALINESDWVIYSIPGAQVNSVEIY